MSQAVSKNLYKNLIKTEECCKCTEQEEHTALHLHSPLLQCKSEAYVGPDLGDTRVPAVHGQESAQSKLAVEPRASSLMREKVGCIENTAMRHRWGG